jgi:hypothetical protein
MGKASTKHSRAAGMVTWPPQWQLVASVAASILFFWMGLKFRNSFPGSYAWSEMLINYQGGFVRRGLLGEIAYSLDWLISARELITACVITLYCFVGAWLVYLASRASLMVAALFLLSPATLLFPLYDFLAFGRKDIFILAAIAGSVIIVQHYEKNRALGMIILVYLIAGPIVDSAWFYFPVAAVMLVAIHANARNQAWQAKAGCLAAIYCVACLLMTWAINRDLPSIGDVSEQQMSIVKSWQALYPNAYPDRLAVTWIGLPLRQGIGMGLYHQVRVTATGYALGFALANVPLVLLWVSSKPISMTLPVLVGQCGAVLAMIATFLLGADWGRYTHLFAIHAFAFCIITRSRCADFPIRSPQSLVIAILAITLYATSWQLEHWAIRGSSAFKPGVLFNLMR